MKKKIALHKKSFNLNTYGYEFSKTDLFLTLVCFTFGSWIVCFFHKLEFIYTLIVMASMLVTLPFLITSYFKYKHEQNRFEDYCIYFEYMKIHFKSRKKIKLALEETIRHFDMKSEMYDCISKAIEEINESGDYKKALGYIDAKYHTSDLVTFHDLLITGERKGVNAVWELFDAINFDLWKQTIKVQQSKKKSMRYMLYGMVAFSIFFSYYGANLFNDPMMGLSENPDYMLYTFIDIECMLLGFVYIYTNMVNKKWLRSDD